MEEELSIIKRCQQGDMSGFASLYDTYVKPIYRFIYYKTHNKEVAEDLTSDTFMKALQHIGRFDPLKGKFQTWLYQIARNTVIDHYRTDKKHDDIDDAWDISDDTNIAEEFETKEQIRKVKSSLSVLTPREREIVTLRVWEELSHEEIAEIVGASEAAVKMAFSRAVAKLKEKVGFAGLVAIIVFQLP